MAFQRRTLPLTAAHYDTTLVYSAEQMYESLGLNLAVKARSGMFGAERKFTFAEEVRFNSTSTFLVARAKIEGAVKRGSETGGEYIAVLSISSEQRQTQRDLAISLKASLDGLFASGSVDTGLQEQMDELRRRCEVRVSVYQRDGTEDPISRPGTVEEVMAGLKTFAKSVRQMPEEPNWRALASRHEEVRKDVMKERMRLLGIRNDLEAILLHPTYFKSPPDATTVSRWMAAVTERLDGMGRHGRAVDQEAPVLPDGFVLPKRVEHSTEQVEIFTPADYVADWIGIPGPSQKLSIGRYEDTKSLLSIGDDQISALKVPAGLAVRGYGHVWFQGSFIDFTADSLKVPLNWTDRISSLIVYQVADGPPVVDHIVAVDSRWSRHTLLLKAGSYPDLAANSLGAGALSTMLIPAGMKVQIWEEPNFGGESVSFFADVLELPAAWSNRAASVEVSGCVE